MTPGVRSHFERELNELAERLMDMGSRARRAVELGTVAFVENNTELAHQVVADDSAINDLRYKIEEQCYLMLAMEQPVASDMRAIVAGLIIANEFERIGDHGKKLARITIRTLADPRPIPFTGISRMAAIVLSMFDQLLAAMANRDAAAARAVCNIDHEIDAHYKQLYNLSLSYMLENARAIPAGTYQIQAAHELERTGDRVTNVAERLVYAVTGELIDLNP